ncbi:hypothetical protein SUGI_0358990 [Cryptomeria japonica]|nr:hypothetical protein SUGI_0358990 [Cryptomeria japonica]
MGRLLSHCLNAMIQIKEPMEENHWHNMNIRKTGPLLKVMMVYITAPKKISVCDGLKELPVEVGQLEKLRE